MARPSAVVLSLLAGASLALGACGDSGEPDGGVPNEKAGPLGLTLEDNVLNWRDQPDEFAYRLTGTVKYGPPCELVEQGLRTMEKFGLDKVLPPDTTRFELPPPEDERLTLVLEVVAKLAVLKEDQTDKILSDGIALTADAFCQ